MQHFTCAWEDTSCTTTLKGWGQTHSKVSLHPCGHPMHKATCQLSLSVASALA